MYGQDVRNQALESYLSGLSSRKVAALLDIGDQHTILQWTGEAGITRPHVQKGERNVNWKGDDVGYSTQHKRAETDFLKPFGVCEICQRHPAQMRMRADHTLFPYRKELIILACQSCNKKHTFGNLSITFSFEGKSYCAARELQTNLVELGEVSK